MSEFIEGVGSGTSIKITCDNLKINGKLLMKAERELNETPFNKFKSIQALREKIENDPDLNSRTDENFLLKFLRARKFDHNRSFRLLQNYYKLKQINAKIFTNFLPSILHSHHQNNIQGILPYRDPNGCAIFVIRSGQWDPSVSTLDDLFLANVMCLEKQIEDPVTQINGFVMILDMKGLGLNQVIRVTPSQVYKLISLVQDAFPARFKAFHVVNDTPLFHFLFKIVKSLFTDKIRNRFFVHGENMQSLHEHLPPDILPLEYDGNLPPFDNTDFIQTLLESEKTFEENQKYGYNSKKTKRN